MRKLLINKQINECLNDLSAEELRLLEASCKEHGIIDPIVVWQGTDFIVDGRNRYNIATKHKIDFDVVEMPFDCIEDVILWAHKHQLGRRNIYGAAATLARANIVKAMRADNNLVAGEQAKLARQLGVSTKTIQRDASASGSVAKLPPDIRKRLNENAIVASQRDLVTLGTLSKPEIDEVAQKLRDDPSLGMHEVLPKKNKAPNLKADDIELIDRHFDKEIRSSIHSGRLPVTSTEIAKVISLEPIDRQNVFDILLANKEVKSLTQALSLIAKPAARDVTSEVKKKQETAVAATEKLQRFADDIATLKKISDGKWHVGLIKKIKEVIEEFRKA